MTHEQQRQYNLFKHKLRKTLQDEYPEYYDPETETSIDTILHTIID